MTLKISANFSLRVIALFLFPAAASAQESAVLGQVVRVAGSDSVPLVGAVVTLHRVTFDGGEPVDSVITNSNGAYRFSGVEFDSLALFVTSAEYAGIAYFTGAINQEAVAAAELMLVYDTSSVLPSIGIAQRHVVVSPTESGEEIGVLEMVIVENVGALTRVSPDSVAPVWSTRIPSQAFQFQVGQSEINQLSITRRGNEVVVVAPLPPGRRQIVYSYMLPRTVESVDFEIDQPVSDINFLIDVRSFGVIKGEINSLGEQEIGNERYSHFQGSDLRAGTPLELAFPGAPTNPEDLVSWLVALATAGMVLAAWLAWHRRSVAVPVAAAPPGQTLAARIAAMDRQFESLDAPTDDQRASYQKQRAEMKEILNRTLAEERHKS